MHKQIRLINSFYLPSDMKDATTAEKYEYFRRMYPTHNYVLLFETAVFGPFPRPEVPWDISEAEKIAKYDPEVSKVLTWVNTKIIINLSIIDSKTLGVLIRIATGMLNKCNIPKCLQIMFHDNMVENLKTEHNEVIMSGLPF